MEISAPIKLTDRLKLTYTCRLITKCRWQKKKRLVARWGAENRKNPYQSLHGEIVSVSILLSSKKCKLTILLPPLEILKIARKA